MEYSYLPDQQILNVQSSGVLSTSDWPALIKAATDEGRKYSCTRFLFDHRQARFRLRFAELWGLPRNRGEFALPPGTRIALLLVGVHLGQKEFIEAFNSNRGFEVKVFDDRDGAIAWLSEPRADRNPLAP